MHIPRQVRYSSNSSEDQSFGPHESARASVSCTTHSRSNEFVTTIPKGFDLFDGKVSIDPNRREDNLIAQRGSGERADARYISDYNTPNTIEVAGISSQQPSSTSTHCAQLAIVHQHGYSHSNTQHIGGRDRADNNHPNRVMIVDSRAELPRVQQSLSEILGSSHGNQKPPSVLQKRASSNLGGTGSSGNNTSCKVARLASGMVTDRLGNAAAGVRTNQMGQPGLQLRSETHDRPRSHQQGQRSQQQQIQNESDPDVVRPVGFAFEIGAFAGLDQVCSNAGTSVASLESFVQAVLNAPSVAMSVLLSCASSTHAPTTTKYCTPSTSTRCRHWNCTCERHVRADYLPRHLLGVLFYTSSTSFTSTATMPYFLPLCNCLNSEPLGSSLTGSDPTASMGYAPIRCDTTLPARWEALQSILSSGRTTKVVFNAQVAMLPLLSSNSVGIPIARDDSRGTILKGVCADSNALVSEEMHPSSLFDPRIAAYLLASDIKESQLELDSLLTAHSVPMNQTMDGLRLGPIAKAVMRCHTELQGLLRLHLALQPALDRAGMLKVFTTIEMPTSVLLAHMELQGVLLSVETVEAMNRRIRQDISRLESQIFIQAGQHFNIASPEQVAHVLFEVLKLPPPAQTSKKGKHQSTSEEDLLRIKHLHPVVDLVLAYRALSKIASTYIDGLAPFVVKHQPLPQYRTNPTAPSSTSIAAVGATTSIGASVSATGAVAAKSRIISLLDEDEDAHVESIASSGADPVEVNAKDVNTVLMRHAKGRALTAAEAAETQRRTHYRVHACFNQTVVRTGRLSCCKPNMQNIPNKQTVAGSIEINVRSAFKPSPGCVKIYSG